jgi:hypothetical protein
MRIGRPVPTDTALAQRVCRSHFPSTTASRISTVGESFRSGTTVPKSVHGYPAATVAAQCLVPADAGVFEVVVVVVRDGVSFRSGSQTVGDRIIARP